MLMRSRQMRGFILLCILGVVTLVTSGCGSYYTHSFKTDVANAGALKILSLAPIEVPSELPQADKAKLFFHAAISEKLTSAGFQVIGQEVFAQKMADVIREKGGAYDPVTGKRDEKKFWELQQACLKKVQAATGAKALLRVRVIPVTVPFSGCSTKWDGATQNVSTTFLGIFCSSAGMYGKIGALSLLITLEDIDGKVLYFNGGGIQLGALHVNRFPFGAFQSVPADQLLGDEMRNRTAVDLSLGPLLSGGAGRP